MPLVFEPLIGELVRLDPSVPDDAPGLLAAAATIDTFRWLSRVQSPFTEDGMAAYLAPLLDDPTTEPLTLRLAASGEIIGATSYRDLRPKDRGLEIGWTFISPTHRRTRVNAEMKRLLLTHAFETPLFPTGCAIRVCLKTHHDNIASQQAIMKLGATHEGTLRNHLIMPDGSYRHSVYYGITSDRWAGVRAGLDARLS